MMRISTLMGLTPSLWSYALVAPLLLMVRRTVFATSENWSYVIATGLCWPSGRTQVGAPPNKRVKLASAHQPRPPLDAFRKRFSRRLQTFPPLADNVSYATFKMRTLLTMQTGRA